MVAAKLANMPRGGDGSNQHVSKSANLQISATPDDAGFEFANAGVANLHLRIPGISQSEAASLLNVSPRCVALGKFGKRRCLILHISAPVGRRTPHPR